MKYLKNLAILITTAFALAMFAGCSSNSSQTTDSSATSDSTSNIEVEKKLLTVNITLPESFFTEEAESGDGKTAEQYAEAAKEEDGILGAKVNSDGSVTLTMTKAKHQEMMDSARQGINDRIDSYISDEESFPSIKEIEHNDSYDTYTLKVDREAFENSWDSLAALGFGITGLYYQYFDGAAEPKVTVDFVDIDSGEVINEVIYPDAVQDNGASTDGTLSAN